MSGIYIPGMEMPTDSTVIAIYKIGGELYAKRCNSAKLYPLVHVPPHGRLIDGDKLAEEQKENVGAYHANLITLDDLAECLLKQSISEDGAPTIIPAEEGDNGT